MNHLACFPVAASLAAAGLAAAGPPPGWKLVWADEFGRDGKPDSRSWTQEQGYVRNHELQFYTVGRPGNARVVRGHLLIEARQESLPFPTGLQTNPGTRRPITHTSASLITLGNHEWLYGHIEVRAKLPRGKGTWPAAWMLGSNVQQVGWPACGEIDIMEWLGREPNVIHGNVHYRTPDNGKASHAGRRHLLEPVEGFNTYAITWTRDQIEFHFNGESYHRFDLSAADHPDGNPFRKPHYLILNLALGGSWGGPVDDSALPAVYQIDYVRVHQPPENK